ncbi:MAG: 16S rRNA (adenine(1518)-N(6)/adenine(1519)-N(6))-dimethyltransferase RsmA [Acidimicrobiia bacterium]
MPVLTSPEVRALLDAHGVRPSRALGQNFLVDANTARRIVDLAEVEPGAHVLEVGPGLGSLTLALAARGVHVHALELDRHLLPVLESVLTDAGASDVEVVHGDALTYDYAHELAGGPWTCISNLPYNVATPVVLRILEEAPNVQRLLVMVQREVGARLAAGPGSRVYGASSVRVRYHATARVVGAVPPTVFHPRPNVESSLVMIERRASPAVDLDDPEAMFRLVRAGFGQRRKMLRRSLRAVLDDGADGILERAGIDPRARAESLDVEDWAALARESAR